MRLIDSSRDRVGNERVGVKSFVQHAMKRNAPEIEKIGSKKSVEVSKIC